MTDPASPPDRLCLVEPAPLGGCTEHARALRMLRDRVIHPSLNALEASIDELESSEEERDAFVLLDVEPLHQATMEGYLLTVQAMFERAVRRLLIGCVKAYLHRDEHETRIRQIQRDTWDPSGAKSLHARFKELLGMPFDALDPDGDLALLNAFGNAVRHGDGKAAQSIHDLCPELWVNWLPPGSVVNLGGKVVLRIACDAPAHPSIHDISLPRALLEQMMQAVLWFWEDLEYIRCRSFRRPHASLAHRLDQQQADRAHRPGQRVWTRRASIQGRT